MVICPHSYSFLVSSIDRGYHIRMQAGRKMAERSLWDHDWLTKHSDFHLNIYMLVNLNILSTVQLDIIS